MKLSFERQERTMTARTVAEVLAAYFAIALLVLASGYFFPQQGEQAGSIPIALSITLLLPIYMWYKNYRTSADLSRQIKERSRGSVLFWVLALFILALLVRVPSVLLFGAPYEKTPLILLVILVILVVEKTDVSAFGFTAKQFGKSLVCGLLLFLMLSIREKITGTTRLRMLYLRRDTEPVNPPEVSGPEGLAERA